MEHAEAHEQLADLALEPRALHALAAAEDRASKVLQAHVAACPLCSADVESWLRTWAAVGASRSSGDAVRKGGAGDPDAGDPDAGDPDAGNLRVLTPPADLRARVLRAVEPAPAPARPAGTSSPVVSLASRRFGVVRRRAVGLVAIAAVVVGLLATGIAVQSRLDLHRAQSDTAALASIESSVGRILAEPDHSEVKLRAADGSTGGILAWSHAEFVVLTSDLAAPAAGQSYRCWVELNGNRTVMGELSFAGSMAAWAAPMGDWQWYFTPGAMFGVSLFPASGPAAAPVLVATL
jgi:hypothetical protein